MLLGAGKALPLQFQLRGPRLLRNPGVSWCVFYGAVLEKQQEELQTWVKGAEEAVNQLQKTVLDSIGWAQKTVAQMQQRLVAVEANPPAAGK